MEIIKTEIGWLNLETNKITEFGEISLDIYNNDKFVLNNLKSFFVKLFPELELNYFDIVNRHYTRCAYEEKLFNKYPDVIALLSSTVNLMNGSKLSYEYHYPHNPEKKEKRYAYLISDSWIEKMQLAFDDSTGKELLFEIISNYTLRTIKCHFLEMQFWEDIEYNYDRFLSFAAFIIDCSVSIKRATEKYRLETIPRWYDSKLYRAYIVNDLNDLYFDDFSEIVNCQYCVGKCPVCKKLFIQKDKRKHFCKNCSNDKTAQKKYNKEKRKESPSGLHKRIYDMLKNRNDPDVDEFYEESIYYKNILKNQSQDIKPQYTENIQTDADYRKWLEKKHKQFIKRPRKIPPAD